MKWLRRIGIGLAVLVALVVVVAFTLYVVGGRKLARTLTAEVHPIAVPSDSASVAEGARLAAVYLCAACHGPHLEGQVMADDPIFGRLVAPHIAPGEGSVTTGFTDESWVRAIRHGVGGDGRPLVVMPASDYNNVSGDDLAKIVAYLKQVPPVDNVPPKLELRLAQVLIGGGMFPLDYDRINHSKLPPAKPASSDVLATGEYLGMVCRGCHGADLMGSEQFGGPQLARGGPFDGYDEAEFRTLLATGVAADGRAIDPALMPWKALAELTDEEQHAVWAYLKTVPASAAK